MIRTLREWKKWVSERGTSGDQVYDILADWEEIVNASSSDYEKEGDRQKVRCADCSKLRWADSYGRCAYCVLDKEKTYITAYIYDRKMCEDFTEDV